MEHPAEIYNKAKRIIFSIFNKDGTLEAYKMLDNYRNKLKPTDWFGLKAELDFYSNHKDEFTLDPTFDFGIKCDFTGNFDGVDNCRIDITTNLDYKRLHDYEAIQRKDNRKYKIVVMDKQTGKIADIFDLNFPIDSSGEGRIFDIALFMPSDSDPDGLRYNFYQDIWEIGSIDTAYYSTHKTTCTDWYIPDFQYLTQNLPDEVNYDEEIKKHAVSSSKVLDRSTNSNIVACAQPFYAITDPHTGEGDWVTKVYWKHPVVADYIDDILFVI
ncbi:hypothetical protein BCL90_3437 [Pedobacter alluvionis]|nr:hypothetical protein BCL90_3437 [Pedobacter alluvionis]